MYIGCQTTSGQLVGVNEGMVYIKNEEGEIKETNDLANTKLILKRLDKLTPEESGEMINHGFSIGRPRGYSFSPEAFLYCISKQIDMFGLIDAGMAIEQSK